MEDTKISPEVRKLMKQLEEDLRAMLDEEFVGKPFDNDNRKVMCERTIAYFELIGHFDLEEEKE